MVLIGFLGCVKYSVGYFQYCRVRHSRSAGFEGSGLHNLRFRVVVLGSTIDIQGLGLCSMARVLSRQLRAQRVYGQS